MAGEMHSINQDGLDSNGEMWETHAAVAKAVGGKLVPFDVYQGPYILVGEDVRVGERPYQLAVQSVGVVRLWLQSDDGMSGQVYREDTDTLSPPFPLFITEEAVDAAIGLLA